MKIKFEINKLSLIKAAFKFNYWKQSDKLLWKKFCDDPAYYLINPLHSDWSLDEIAIQSEMFGFKNTFLKTAKNLEKIYREIIRSNKFKKLLSETEKYKNNIEKQWNKNQKFVFNFIKNELGLKIPNHTVTVFIFHPKFFKGRANHEKKYILWGHPEDWKNYSIVYICHELLHILTWNKLKDHETMHAIIELATDNELRIRLNEKGEYFKEKKLEIGHLYLRKLERKILPYWKKYLKKRGNKNIFDFEKKIKTSIK